jgi:hypothetical protein
MNRYRVTIKATILQEITVEAPCEEYAIVDATERFRPDNPGRFPEKYDQQVEQVVEIPWE